MVAVGERVDEATALAEARSTAAPGAMRRAEQVAIAIFGTWMLTGLFLDGWAHRHDKPETFFTPWHGILYSGFGAAVAWSVIDGLLARRRHETRIQPVGAGLTTLGGALFVTGAVGDGIWHSVFGFEVDIEALVSPSHLLLMIGGLMAVTGPFRAAWASDEDDRPSLRAFAPTLAVLTLGTALVAFFFMYLSAFLSDAYAVGADAGGGDGREAMQVWGIASIMATNFILLAPLLLGLKRWRLPAGSCTVLIGAVALGMQGLEGFDHAALLLPALFTGVVADIVISRYDGPAAPIRMIGAVVPLTLWPTFFLTWKLAYGLGWQVELWLGTTVLSVVAGIGLALLAAPVQAGVARSRPNPR